MVVLLADAKIDKAAVVVESLDASVASLAVFGLFDDVLLAVFAVPDYPCLPFAFVT